MLQGFAIVPSQAADRKLDDLLCSPPDPVADKAALIALRDAASPVAKLLAKRLSSDSNWRDLPLRELLPGLPLIDSSLFRYRLSTQTANGLARGDVRSWAALADLPPSELFSLPRIGGKAVEEILLAATGEWAAAYLRAAGDWHEEASVQDSGKEQLLALIRRAPDPVADRPLLITLASPDNADTQWLAERLHRDGGLRHSSLRQSLPGLGLVESPAFAV